MAFLLDTNILSALIDFPRGPVAQRAERAGSRNVFTSIINAGEVRFGAVRKNSARLTARVEELLERIEVAPLKPAADHAYGSLRAHLERAGTPIGSNDIWIAAHALATDSILVTDNVKEFSRVPGLKIENWLR
jgi:tRNA(fMet)-specific endonuclease VapC